MDGRAASGWTGSNLKPRGAETKIITTLLAALLIGCAAAEPQTLEPPKPKETEKTASLDVHLPGPSSETDAAYLGLARSEGPFCMDQIKARVLVIEIFDMYCRFCQAAAPKVDQAYELFLHSGFSDEVKMIGIGRMNTELEVSTFKEKYKVRFPLFADKDLSITRALHAQDEGTPHFIVLKKESGDRAQVVYTRTGTFEDPKAFCDAILKRSDLEKE